MCECAYCGSKALETAILKSALPGPPKMRSTWVFDEPTHAGNSSWVVGSMPDPRTGRVEAGYFETHHVTGLSAGYVRNLIERSSWEFQ